TSKFNPGAYSCQSNNLYQDYISYTCNNPGTASASCTSGKEAKQIQTCSSSQKCQIGLWYTGCVSPTTTDTTDTNTNTTNTTNTNNNTNTTYPTSSCTSHATKGCINNSVYWYNSCGTQQEVYKSCSLTGQVCQEGGCTGTPVVKTTS